MKKLFIVMAVASLGFVACNNESSTEKTGDTTVVAPVVVDTTAPKVDTTVVKVDTSAVKDTLKK